MRAAGPDTDFVFNEDGTLLGVFLAPDYCAEHEWGIQRLKDALGIASEVPGVERRRVQETEGVYFEKTRSRALLSVGVNRYTKTRIAENEFTLTKSKKDLSGAWDSNEFALVAKTKEKIAHLKTIHQAFLDRDVLVMLGNSSPNNPFSRSGLSIGIISRMPENFLQDLKEADLDATELAKAVARTGIHDVVPSSAYFALSPSWIKDTHVKKETEFPVIFWLNPHDQQENAALWATVEELRAWQAGEAPDGPIAGQGMKYKRQRRASAVLTGDLDQLYGDEICCRSCKEISNFGRQYYRSTKQKCQCGSEDVIASARPHW